jgi:hypothetical protein
VGPTGPRLDSYGGHIFSQDLLQRIYYKETYDVFCMVVRERVSGPYGGRASGPYGGRASGPYGGRASGPSRSEATQLQKIHFLGDPEMAAKFGF